MTESPTITPDVPPWRSVCCGAPQLYDEELFIVQKLSLNDSLLEYASGTCSRCHNHCTFERVEQE